MEKIVYLPNGQWSLEKAKVFDISTRKVVSDDGQPTADQTQAVKKKPSPQSLHNKLIGHELNAINSGQHPSSKDPHFMSAFKKLGHKKIEHLASRAAVGNEHALNLDPEIDGIPDDTFDYVETPEDSYHFSNTIKSLNDNEKQSVKKYLNKYHSRIKGM